MSDSNTDRLYQASANGRLVHGYLLTGNDYEGKRAYALHLIQSLGCLDPQADGPCGICDICQRAVMNQLPDIYYVEPEGATVKVDQIRQLKEWLNTSPLELGFKVALIDQAQVMTPQAMNALLTVLEEPNDDVYLILYTQEAQQVLPTIQSRVQTVHFPTPGQATRIAEWEEAGMASLHAHIMAHLASDAAEYWVAHYDSEAMGKWFDALNHFLASLVARNTYSFILVHTELSPYLQGRQAQDSLDYLMLLIHQGLVSQGMQNPNQAQVQTYYLKQLLGDLNWEPNHWLQLYHLALSAKQKLHANVPAQAVYEQMALLACQQ